MKKPDLSRLFTGLLESAGVKKSMSEAALDHPSSIEKVGAARESYNRMLAQRFPVYALSAIAGFGGLVGFGIKGKLAAEDEYTMAQTFGDMSKAIQNSGHGKSLHAVTEVLSLEELEADLKMALLEVPADDFDQAQLAGLQKDLGLSYDYSDINALITRSDLLMEYDMAEMQKDLDVLSEAYSEEGFETIIDNVETGTALSGVALAVIALNLLRMLKARSTLNKIERQPYMS